MIFKICVVKSSFVTPSENFEKKVLYAVIITGRHCLFDFRNFWSNYCKYGNYSVGVVGRRLQSTFLVRVRGNPQRVLLIKIRIKKSLLCRLVH